MADRISAIEERLAGVEQRLRALEGTPPDLPGDEQSGALAAPGAGFLAKASTLIGRVLLIFGGAYLLRAITEGEHVPTGFGVFLGATYALLWLFMAFRNGGIDDRRTSAMLYGGASVLLTLPLLVEATTTFQLLSGQHGIIALAIFCGLTYLVAVTRDLRSLAWLTTAGGILTALYILRTSHSAVSVAVFLGFLGLGALWAVYLKKWVALQWLGGFGAAAGVAALTLLSRSDQWAVEPLTAYVLGACLMAAYLLSFAVQSHVRDHDVGLFEATQGVLTIGVVSWAAGVAAQADQLLLPQVGALSLIIGAGAYALAFTPATRSARGRNFFFYSTLGLALVVAGSALLISTERASVAWSLMALVMAWLSGRYGRVSLSLQCTFLVIAAGVGSGLLGTGLLAFVGNAATTWPPLAPWHLLVALTTVICLFIPVAQHSERWGTLAGLPQLTILALSVWEVGGLLVIYLAPIIAEVPGPAANLAILAALRTAVLAVSSVTLALSSNHKRWPEARWLVYPVLILVGIKLFVEDFPHGQPVSLFLALGLVGSALILVSKLMSWKKTIEESDSRAEG